jgi:hypothetical protein
MGNNWSSASLVLLVLAACGGSKSSGFGDADGGFLVGDGGSGTFIDSGNGGPGPGVGATVLYAHTSTELFQLDPKNISAPMKPIGKFDCIGNGSGPSSMTDIAVSKDGALFGVSNSGAYPLQVTGSNVHCAAVWPLPTSSNFYGLTMAPENTVDAQETLIAANDAGALYRIDAVTGKTTQVGTLGVDAGGQPWALSGDIVFLANGGNPVAFATVRICTGASQSTCGTTDTLIELDVSKVKPGTQSTLKAIRGPVVKGSWCTNAASPTTFGSMFGIAAYDDKVYGFSNQGDVVEIHNDDGSGCLVSNYPKTSFKGAGVTTSAPVKAPPIK